MKKDLSIRIIGWTVLIVSGLVILGWIFDIVILKSIVPGLVTMKFTTATAFLLSGLVLIYTFKKDLNLSKWSDIILSLTTLVILLIMGTISLSVILNFNSGIEKLFVEENSDAVLTIVPGRPSVSTTFNFIVIALLGITGLSGWSKRKSIYLYGGLVIFLIGTLAIIGYLFSIPFLYSSIENISTAMALHTANLFLLLGIGFYIISTKVKLN